MRVVHRPTPGFVTLCLSGLVLLGAWSHFCSAAVGATASVSTSHPFIVFDATLYKNKPSFTGYPFRPITLLYESQLFPGKQSSTAMPSEQIVRSLARASGATLEPVVVDIERWPLKGDAQAVKENVAKLMTILAWITQEAPTIKLGTYGTIPLPDYWRAIRGPLDKDYQAWQRDNDRLEELAAYADALYPSLYTFYADRQGWVTYAVAQLTEAKRKAKGKPVYAFLMPLYHESNRQLGLRPLEPDYWELQLNTVAQHADGIVIWGGWGANGPDPWNEEAPWWQVTKRFLKQIGATTPNPPTNLFVQ